MLCGGYFRRFAGSVAEIGTGSVGGTVGGDWSDCTGVNVLMW